MVKRKGRWLAMALSTAMAVSALQTGNINVSAATDDAAVDAAEIPEDKALEGEETEPETEGEDETKSETKGANEAEPEVEEAESLGETKPEGEAETADETKPEGEAETADETKPEPETVGKTKSEGETVTADEAEAENKGESADESESETSAITETTPGKALEEAPESGDASEGDGDANETTPETKEPTFVEEIGDSNLVAHFTFDNEEYGFTGRGAKATSNGGYTIVTDDVVVGDGALKLSAGEYQWLDVKSLDGKNVLGDLKEITINYFSKSGDHTNWSFFAAPSTDRQVYMSEKYFGIGDPVSGRINVERYYSNNIGRPDPAKADEVSGWKMVTVTANKRETKLYVNGELKDTASSTAKLENIFGGDEGIFQIGKANWDGGEFSNLTLDDYAVFDRALSEEEIAELYETKDVEAVEYIDPNETNGEGQVKIRVTSATASYEKEVKVESNEDYSLLANTCASITFDDGKVKDDAVIAWYEGDKRVHNTNELGIGTHELTGKLTYFGNPVIDEKADPYVIYNEDDDYYYFTSSWPAYGSVDAGYDRIALRRSKTLAGLSEAEDVAIWTAPESGALSKHIWAPELHKIDGKWYVYFAGTCDDGLWSIRPFVLMCNDSADLMDPSNWELKGRFENKDGSYDGAFDAFSLDMTYFEVGGKSYVVWAYKTDASVLKIGEIDPKEPWKLISDAVTISTPTYAWEKNGGQTVDEGPAFLEKDGKIYLAFSASATGPEYCMGLLTASSDADLLNPDSWEKKEDPVLSTDDLKDQYGPGHNSFTVDKDGNIIVVYHARDKECYEGKCKWAGGDPLYDPCRNANMAILRFDANGEPVFTSTEEVEMQNLPESEKTFKMTVIVGDSKDCIEYDTNNLDIPGKEDVRGNITLPEVGEKGSVITWKSSDPEAVTDTDNGKIKKGVVNRGSADKKVTLTATLTNGEETAEKTFEILVKAKAEEKKFNHYLFAYFTGEKFSNGEQIYFADSDDGLHFEALNMGCPVIKSKLGEKGLRDPFIIRSPEGDKFYLIATDLKINGGGNNVWGNAQSNGSKSIMIWESTDLVNWSDQRMVEVANENAGCTWAPEAFYDDETGEYIVFWASMIDGFHKIWYSTTRDFYSFSEPEVWITLKNKDGREISIIDTSVFAVTNEDGTKTYFRVSKDEASSDAIVNDGDPYSGKFEILETATSLTGEWTRIHSDFLNSTTGVEGGTIFKFNDEDKYCLLLDGFGKNGYFPCVTDDLASGEFRMLEDDEYSYPSIMRHGTVIGITDEEYAAIEAKWGEDRDYGNELADAAIAHFTFDSDESGFEYKNAVIKEHNGYDVTTRGDGSAISLNKNKKQYFTIENKDGSGLLAGLKEFTINYFSKTDAAPETQWILYAAEDDRAPSYPHEKYIGITDPLYDSLLHVERYNNNGSRSENNKVDIAAYDDDWKMVTVAFHEDMTLVYINGKLVSTVGSDVTVDEILGEAAVLQIGKANWESGEYTTAEIDDISIFNRPLSGSEIKSLFEGTAKFEKEEPSGQDEPEVPDEPSQDVPTPGSGQESGNVPEAGNGSEAGNSAAVTPSGNTPATTASEVKSVDNNGAVKSESAKDEIPTVKGKIKKIKSGKNKGLYQLKLEKGGVAKGLVSYKKKTYYFDKKGVAKKGFHKVNGKKIYTDAKGKLVKGFKKIGKDKYYFDERGYMVTGKVKIGKYNYKFDKNGKLQKKSKITK